MSLLIVLPLRLAQKKRHSTLATVSNSFVQTTAALFPLVSSNNTSHHNCDSKLHKALVALLKELSWCERPELLPLVSVCTKTAGSCPYCSSIGETGPRNEPFPINATGGLAEDKSNARGEAKIRPKRRWCWQIKRRNTLQPATA